MKAKKIAVVLSGCGNKDGTEITEAVSLIIGLSQAGAEVSFFAPNSEFPAKDFLTNKALLQPRNAMLEAARITRGHIHDIKELNANYFDGLALPGGWPLWPST